MNVSCEYESIITLIVKTNDPKEMVLSVLVDEGHQVLAHATYARLEVEEK